MKKFPVDLSLQQIAEIANGELILSHECSCNAVASLEEADEHSVAFFQDPKLENVFQSSRAGVIIISKKNDIQSLPQRNYILCEMPYVSFLRIIAFFQRQIHKPVKGKDIHPTAIIHENVTLPDNIRISANVVVHQNVNIGDRTVLDENVVINKDVKVGKNCHFYPNVIVYNDVIIGNDVNLHAGVVVGSDGFGYLWDGGKHQKIPQVGGVIIEDDVEIGANVTIDRGALGDTIIRKGAKIDNLVQIAHNVDVGEYTILCSQVGIAGSSKIGKNCILAGQVGVADHVKVGKNVKIGAQSGVPNDIPDNKIVLGYPAMDVGLQRKILVSLKELPEIRKFIHRLKKKDTHDSSE
ncbi:MAG TPA: UDP-3-O-(3-hydroxymyristoyl)glucosamine N-acyltransferase [Candidatus Cloacimonetes bacterium]|nr:UDP-3-O-(3-hydroxymyristoyl)glucosamine N-acyltransferase [Candidatus Cloacimonadota bacterium]HEX37737.1 UDP-3-O-(3-hydroxymyristoyl)glucosamine N-acyltransferase [Candidatus Cloacimonadota bacterium]